MSKLARWARYHTPGKKDGKCYVSFDWYRLCLDYLKQNNTPQDGHNSCAQWKLHDTRKGEDTKGALQVLLPRTITHVVFTVEISNMRGRKMLQVTPELYKNGDQKDFIMSHFLNMNKLPACSWLS